ncbi:MAG: 2-amino-4-hydroxy-6-hydroxymethyldihydropteridine diphosphokinase [Candidatus Omnitrophica bacterium]|nr:2-amino-4-hydroxy-6-hydroxymethyldihydropteridine diphosphokinase [Candidatus Omnitrophota bacterium]
MNRAVIGLGSNIDPEKNIEQGRVLICGRFRVIRFSRFLKTPPKGNFHQPEFVNGGVLIETDLSESQVKTILKEFEIGMGRTNAMHCNKPRIIDFDVHVWNDSIVDPFFYEWDFLRTIILELLPNLHYDHSKVV